MKIINIYIIQNSTMRKLIQWVATLVGVTASALPFAARADVPFDPPANTNSPSSAGPLFTYTSLDNVPPVVAAAYLINAVLGILGIIALILIIYAGFMWMFSRGNEEKVGTAVKILRDAFIGLLIIIGSYGISFYIFEVINYAT